MAQDISPKGNHLPSLEQLSALAKGRVPQNTVMNTEKWVKIMNKWRADVNYNYLLESQDKDTIELQVTQFLCGVDFPDLYARFDGLLKDMKKKGIGKTKSTDGLSTDEIRAPRGGEHVNLLASQLADTPDGIIFKKGQQKNDQGGVNGNQFDLNIPFPPDPPGIAGPNHDIRKFLSLRPQKGKCPYLYLSVRKWYRDKQIADHTIRSMFKTICVECNIDIKERNICNHSGRKTSIFELFDLEIPENTGMSITGHHSVGGYRAYAKPNNSHKSEALSGIVNQLNGLPLLPSLNTTSKRKNSINESDFSQSTSISESDSDFDVDESR
ncbi:hypothetical protein GLOIN_2v1787594 [Rhizophagus clarus]|uniref:Uncharacterized protein n=1 Tax=Rhizophagus clarus TaxID=94130 RepID=A0A8H3KSN8_9GLOM|nr:hypothetical protein GLOIN_2v1787594 [Rhizophagus clarus]